MFKKMMASMGVGSAKVETVLNQRSLRKGETLTGYILVKGGAVDQEISGIDLHIQTKVKKESNDSTYYETVTLQRQQVVSRFTIAKGQERRIEFSMVLNKNLPFTMGRTTMWVYTDLNIESAIDSADHDALTINPTEGEQRILNAMQELGAHVKESEVEERYFNFFGGRQFVQEIDYHIRGSWNIEEVEITFVSETEDEMILSIEVDKAFSFRSDRAFEVRINKYGNLTQQLQNAIADVARRS